LLTSILPDLPYLNRIYPLNKFPRYDTLSSISRLIS
jgi:hypothetical protein